MKRCCVNCFKDTYIKSFIQRNGSIGCCSYCKSDNVLSVEVDDASEISEKITRLLQIYAVSDDKRAKELSVSLSEDWDIFDLNPNKALELTRDLSSDFISSDNRIYSDKVLIPQIYDEAFVDMYGITKDYSWKEFSEYIKYINRFHSGKFNEDAFTSFLSASVRIFSEKDRFYRARICDAGIEGYQTHEMGIPPKEKRNPGRINPAGIGVLYLSLDPETVLYEVRASKFDKITIGTFRVKRDIRIIDLSGIESLSPFVFDDDDMIERYALNKNIFRDISTDLAKPMRRNDSISEYLPTQYIAEFVKYQQYDGVAYKSTIHEGGYNIALFDETKVSCVDVETREVTDVKYESNDIR